MENSTAFSIIVPVYNAEPYLDECICSVLNQTYDNYELIIVDDGSTDKSLSICQEYAEKNSKIFVYHKKNQGTMHTRLYGINKSRGKYLLFLDADDYLEADALKCLIEVFSDRECDIIIFGYRSFTEQGNLDSVCDVREELLINKRYIYRRCLSKTGYNSLCRKAIRANVFGHWDYTLYYSLRYGEDLLLSLEALKYCNSVYFLDKTLYNYRMNPKSVTHSKKSKSEFLSETIAFEKVLSFLQEEEALTGEDLDYIRDARLTQVFIPLLKRIMCEDITRKDKIDIFQKISRSSSYKNFYKAGIKNVRICIKDIIVFNLYKFKFYDILVILGFISKKTR